jgi:hypothetical protein
MELFYFTIGWVISLGGFYVIHKLLKKAEK